MCIRDRSKIRDTAGYNRAVFWLWALYGALFAVAGALCINRYDLLERVLIGAGAALVGLIFFLAAYRLVVRHFCTRGR